MQPIGNLRFPGTPPTRNLARLLAKDTLKLQGGRYDCPFTHAELVRIGEVSATHGYRETFEAAGHEVTFFDAGHIPGSAHVLVDASTRDGQRERIAEKRAAIVTTAGMLENENSQVVAAS